MKETLSWSIHLFCPIWTLDAGVCVSSSHATISPCALAVRLYKTLTTAGKKKKNKMANQTTVFLYISRLGVAVLPCLKRILTRQWWYAKGVSYLAVIFLWREADIPWISSARRWSQLQWIDKESDSTPFAPRHLALRKDCLVYLLVWWYVCMYVIFFWGGGGGAFLPLLW